VSRIHLIKEPDLGIRHQAFSYQAAAVSAIRDLDYAAIFHEQGLGKTKIAIDLMLYWLENKLVDTVLFVVKKGLIENWKRELSNHTFIKPRILSRDHRGNFFVFNSPARVMLAHYEVLSGEKERMKLFLKTRDVGVIADEAVKLKNPDSAITSAMFELSPLFKRRVIMTGTPVANRPHDLWAQIWFLDQGKSLGIDFASFKRDLDLSNKLGSDSGARSAFEEELQGIYAKISAFCVRERKNSGVINLPEKVIQTVIADWEPRQSELYREVRDNLRAIVVRDGLPTEDHAENLLKRVLRLVQIASNPHMVDERYTQTPGKLPYLCDIVLEISRKKEKCIVWTSFKENVDWLAKELRAHGACRVHGGMTMDERTKNVDRFLKEDTCRLMLATPGAAKEGLTLTVANHVIFYDRSFSLDDYLQAQDRIHRISQKKTCYIYNLIMRESVDEWVDVLLHSKELAAQLAQGDISTDFYRSQMTYAFGDILQSVLGLQAKAKRGKNENA
jgi:SNF2 family DNA or RNA helicase